MRDFAMTLTKSLLKCVILLWR